ncbi:MAG: hypothetical protein HKN88_07910 [Gammaproteobacteria bacterium]|nr:hypothetical protein [Gammaproteobacteria bacterium]NNC97984.1 hypothetical protein [Gammaproteobacteria bacterium]NNM14444.1 hypothetical protein [Gammaproteobacteria bacterium]
MKKLIYFTVALLIFSLNNALSAQALEGKIVKGHDYKTYIMEHAGHKYMLEFDELTELKPNQTVQVKGDKIDTNKLAVKEVKVITGTIKSQNS